MGSFVEMRMDLETVIQSEVSQKEKQKYWILRHICGEGKGNPLQYSCLENPMDGGAWYIHPHVNSDRIFREFPRFRFHILKFLLSINFTVKYCDIYSTVGSKIM